MSQRSVIGAILASARTTQQKLLSLSTARNRGRVLASSNLPCGSTPARFQILFTRRFLVLLSVRATHAAKTE